MDYTNFKFVYRIVMIIQLICCGTIGFLSEMKIAYLLIVCFSLACMGGHYALFPTVTINTMGLRKGPEIYGLLFYSFGVASLLTIVYVKIILPTLGYSFMFLIFEAMTLVAFILTFFFEEKTDWSEILESKRLKEETKENL